jgi:hypothetical protein
MQLPQQMLQDVLSGYNKYEYEPGFAEYQRQLGGYGQIANWLGGVRGGVGGGEAGSWSAQGGTDSQSMQQLGQLVGKWWANRNSGVG